MEKISYTVNVNYRGRSRCIHLDGPLSGIGFAQLQNYSEGLGLYSNVIYQEQKARLLSGVSKGILKDAA